MGGAKNVSEILMVLVLLRLRGVIPCGLLRGLVFGLGEFLPALLLPLGGVLMLGKRGRREGSGPRGLGGGDGAPVMLKESASRYSMELVVEDERDELSCAHIVSRKSIDNVSSALRARWGASLLWRHDVCRNIPSRSDGRFSTLEGSGMSGKLNQGR